MDHIYQTLGNLRVEPKIRVNKLPAKYIYQDEKTGQIKEILLSSAASESINEAQLIHDFMFGH